MRKREIGKQGHLRKKVLMKKVKRVKGNWKNQKLRKGISG